MKAVVMKSVAPHSNSKLMNGLTRVLSFTLLVISTSFILERLADWGPFWKFFEWLRYIFIVNEFPGAEYYSRISDMEAHRFGVTRPSYSEPWHLPHLVILSLISLSVFIVIIGLFQRYRLTPFKLGVQAGWLVVLVLLLLRDQSVTGPNFVTSLVVCLLHLLITYYVFLFCKPTGDRGLVNELS